MTNSEPRIVLRWKTDKPSGRFYTKTMMTYEEVCAEMGYTPESGMVRLTDRGAITCDPKVPKEVADEIYAACVRAGFRPSHVLMVTHGGAPELADSRVYNDLGAKRI